MFHGAVYGEDRSRLVARCDAFVLFSDCEGFSVATAEALTQGLPAIVTDCGGPREYMSKRHGITIKPRDIPALADAMTDIIRNYKKYDSEFISRSMMGRFVSERVGEELYKLYNSIVSSHTYKVWGFIGQQARNKKRRACPGHRKWT